MDVFDSSTAGLLTMSVVSSLDEWHFEILSPRSIM